MELDLDTITVNKLVGLGRREISEDGSVRSRPLRFSVEVFEHKRQTLKANNLIRTCTDNVYKKVQVGKDQEKAQSDKDSHSKNRGGKKPN